MRFSGAAEREAYYQRLSALPEKTRHKLRAINREGHSDKVPPKGNHNVKHILMAIKAALFDFPTQQVVFEMVGLRRKLHRAKQLLLSLHPDPAVRKPLRLTLEPELMQKNLAEAQLYYAKSAEAVQDYHIAMDWMTGRQPYPVIPTERIPLVEDCPVDQLPLR